MTVNFNIALTKNQRKCLDLLYEEDTRYLICNWSRQCGKTVTAEILMIQYLCKQKTFSYYISPSFSQGRKVYNEITTLLDGKGIIKKANSSTLTIESVYGSTLQFFSFENITAVRGYTVKNGLVVIDEASFAYSPQEENPFMSVIYPTIKANFKRNKVLVISTPKGKQGLFWNLWCKALNKEQGFKYLEATIYDDSLVTPQQIEEIKSMMPPIIFQEEFECKFLDSSLTFFQGFENCFKDYVYDTNCKEWFGIDLSATEEGDDTVLTRLNEKGQTDSIVIKGNLSMKYQQIANLINNAKNLQGTYIEENGVGFAMIHSIKQLVNRKTLIHSWTTTNKTKNDILSTLAIKITDKELMFNNLDTNLFSQFGTFITKYSKTGKLQLEAQAGYKDDKVMSMAIALEARESLNKPYNRDNFNVVDIAKIINIR